MPGASNSALVGCALDSHRIFGARDTKAKFLTNSDLDASQGRAESVVADGRSYHYAYRLTLGYLCKLG